jgi:hypothetical protein
MKKVVKIIGGIFAVIVVGFIALALFAPSEQPTKVASTTPAAKADTKKEPEQPKVFNVGDTIKYNGLEVTITKAEYTPPTQYGTPKKGKVLTLYITAKNVSQNDKLMVDNTEFNLYDAAGVKLEQYYSYDETAISGTIDPGTALQGKVYYDVPEAASYKLIYTPSFSANADGSNHINVNIKMQ